MIWANKDTWPYGKTIIATILLYNKSEVAYQNFSLEQIVKYCVWRENIKIQFSAKNLCYNLNVVKCECTWKKKNWIHI